MKPKSLLKKRAMLSLLALVTSFTVGAQYVFVTAYPGNGGEIRVGKSLELGVYQDGGSFVDGVEPGETVYFDFRPYAGWQSTGISFDANLSAEDVTALDGGVYSFAMPDYEGTLMVMIKIGFEKIPEVVTGVEITEENFPDANFRKWLLSQAYGTDAVITDAEMAAINKIVARGCGIADLTGIAFFSGLTELDVSNLPETHPEEQWNRIASLDLSGNSKLRKLWANHNLLSSIDLSACPDLRNLDVSNNLLTEFDVTHNTALLMLNCDGNLLSGLDLSKTPDLGVLSCNGNRLTTLDVSNNLLLEQLFCENNQLISIDVTDHKKLMLFNCNDNQLTSLDLKGCTELFQLYFYNNRISGQSMQDLVNSLETPPRGGYMVVMDRDSEVEQNEMTVEQAAVARGKSWSVEVIQNGDFAQFEGNEDTHQYVDLGLPSGTLWATCNVGATRSTEAGLFFAWGDTNGHGADPSDGYLFSWENYLWAEVTDDEAYFTKYCSDSSRGLDGFTDGLTELVPEDDAAYVNWGSQWRMPTKEQQDELKEECTWTWTTVADVNGYEVTGPNGNSIFLPETGWRIDDMLLEGGAYWSRTTDAEMDGGAYYIGFDSWGEYTYGGRLDGQCVRPVVNADQPAVKKGDVNGDGEVGVADVSKLVDLLINHSTNERSDVNGDGETSIADLTMLVSIILEPTQ